MAPRTRSMRVVNVAGSNGSTAQANSSGNVTVSPPDTNQRQRLSFDETNPSIVATVNVPATPTRASSAAKADNKLLRKMTPEFLRRKLRSPLLLRRTSTPRPRSRSEPGPVQRRHRHKQQHHRVLEDHFRYDRKSAVVLPGVPRYEEDWQRDLHDFFNLVVLVPVIILNVLNWNWEKLLLSRYNVGVADAWTGDHFGPFFVLAMAYFLIDAVWIYLVPRCVKSPSTILQHHVATMVYMLLPYRYPQVQWCMGACLVVEVNTWFLIARRVFNKQGFSPWTIKLSVVSVRVKLISILFYTTWIVIRCLLYPYLLVPFYRCYLQHSRHVGTYWNPILICLPLQTTFCLLNLKWSYDLLMSKIRYWRRRARNPHAKQDLQKGL